MVRNILFYMYWEEWSQLTNIVQRVETTNQTLICVVRVLAHSKCFPARRLEAVRNSSSMTARGDFRRRNGNTCMYTNQFRFVDMCAETLLRNVGRCWWLQLLWLSPVVVWGCTWTLFEVESIRSCFDVPSSLRIGICESILISTHSTHIYGTRN